MKTPRLKDLQIVTIDNPYDCLRDELARDVWAKIMALKIAGYRSEYDYGVLPVDASDFYCAHMAICRKLEDGQLAPVLAIKSLSLDRHKAFSKDEFVLVDHFRRSGAEDHLRAIRELILRAENTKKSLHYLSSYTTDPALRGNPLFTTLLREVLAGMYINFHVEFGIEISTAGGAKQFKVDKVLESYGYERLKLKGEPLPDYSPACIHGNGAVFFEMEKFSEYALEMAKKYRAMWESRLHFGKEQAAVLELKKAA